MNWLDTETKAILQKEDTPKLAPPTAAEFALVLLRKGTDDKRLVRAIRRINECIEPDAVQLAHQQVPVTINPGLKEEEALFGQFELICCDAIAPFIRSEVLLEQANPAYLQSLFQQVLESREFKPTKVEILNVPATESGQKFVDQFLGIPLPGADRPFPRFSVCVPFKKARIMKHWAARVGADVCCDALEGSPAEADAI